MARTDKRLQPYSILYFQYPSAQKKKKRDKKTPVNSTSHDNKREEDIFDSTAVVVYHSLPLVRSRLCDNVAGAGTVLVQ